MRRQFANLTTVLDVGCGDGAQMCMINPDKKYEVTGIDLYKPYLEKAKKTNVYKKVLLGDVRTLSIPDSSYDIVFCSQVVEHLTKNEAVKLIKEMERIARKKVIIGTTNGFFPFDPLEGKDGNPLQVHKSGWTVDEMRKMKYAVFGQGLGIVYKPGGLAHNASALKPLWFAISYILSPITYFFPVLSAYIISVKNEK